MTPAEFLPIFHLVCNREHMSPEARQMAWLSCYERDRRGDPYPNMRVINIYRMLAALA